MIGYRGVTLPDLLQHLTLQGFRIAGIEIVSMANGGSPDAVLERKDLLDKAKSVGSSL